ncbi:hypothetical protein ANN_13397 [Periplaneta americana]|uniref:Uncharacterized protein n=1 Tax=Periplaneta americana TaxID=6978 RepID=A0ABQ8TMT4_PERAM|nr:hypothetical protein ANN_13397 [Periplaneta americana]
MAGLSDTMFEFGHQKSKMLTKTWHIDWTFSGQQMEHMLKCTHENFTVDTQGILLLQEKFTKRRAQESNPGPPDPEASMLSMLTNRPRRQSR